MLEVLRGAEHASGEVWLGGHYHQRGIRSPAASFPKLHYRTQHMSWVCGTFLYLTPQSYTWLQKYQLTVSFPPLLVISCVKFHYMVADGTKIMHAHTGVMLTNAECPTLFKSCSLGARACTTPKICCLSFYPWTATATTCVVGHTSSQRSKQSSATGVIFDGSNSFRIAVISTRSAEIVHNPGEYKEECGRWCTRCCAKWRKGIGTHLHPPEL